MITLGVTSAVCLIGILYLTIDISNLTEFNDRLGFTVCCLLVSALSIVIGIVATGNNVWGNSDPIDLVFGGSGNFVSVANRNLQNTTEQLMITMLTTTLYNNYLKLGNSMRVAPI